MNIKTAKQLCKGQPLPVRISLWCAANEPTDKANDITEKLIETFADVSFDDLTGYERRVLSAVTEGSYSR